MPWRAQKAFSLESTTRSSVQLGFVMSGIWRAEGIDEPAAQGKGAQSCRRLGAGYAGTGTIADPVSSLKNPMR